MVVNIDNCDRLVFHPFVILVDINFEEPQSPASLPNGSKAAILAERYRSSGVRRFLLVKSEEKVRACASEQ